MNLLQALVDSMTTGSVFALLGIGISLIFGIMRLVNFAHGELVMVGAYAAGLVVDGPWPIALLASLAIPIAFALIMERLAFRPVRGASEATLLVTSFAISYLLQSVAFLMFGATPKSVDLLPGLNRSVQMGSVQVPLLSIVTVVVVVALLCGLSVFLRTTSIGTQMRAAAEDFTMARLLGVNADRVIATAFAISGLLAGVAAFLTVAQTGQIFPTMGLNAILVAFVATTLGGLGSLVGAVVGGYAFGAVSVFLGAYLPPDLRVYADAFGYLLVIVVLVTRPNGLIVPRSARTRV